MNKIDFDSLVLDEIGQWPFGFRILILLGIAAITFSLGYSIDIQSSWNNFLIQRDINTTAEEEYRVLYPRAQDNAAYQNEIQEFYTQFLNSNIPLPNSCQEAELLESLSELAAQSGLQFKAIKPLPEEIKANYIEHPFEILLFGTYHQLGEFVDRLATLPRIVTLHDFSIQKEKNSSMIEILIHAKAYRSSTEISLAKHFILDQVAMLPLPTSFSPSLLYPQENSCYNAKNLGNPFDPSEKSLSGSNTSFKENATLLDPHRARELLESHPLDSLRMVGYIEKDQQYWGLILDANHNIHRIQEGHYIGINEGKIEKVSPEGIEIRERTFMEEHPSQEKTIFLPLKKLDLSEMSNP